MKFVVLAALFAAALAADMQLSLTWDCNFHVNLTKNNVYGYHDLHGVMGEQSLLYLHDFCFAAANSTRILRYDVKNNNYMPFVSNTTSGCSFGHTGDWVDWDTIVFRRSFIHNRDPGNVLCPPEIPELAGRTCKEYIYDTYYRYDRIIVDDANRVAWWSRDGGYFFHWLNGTIPAESYELHYCDKDVVLTAPSRCAASLVSVAKLLVAAVLLIALL